MLPARLRQSRARAHRRRNDQEGDAGRVPVAVARHPARVSRVRADVDHGGERLYRAEGRRLCEGPEVEPRRHRLQGRSVDHALERRRDDAGGRDRAAGGDDGVRAGRRHHCVGAGRPGARLSERHLVRHGRHHRQGEPDPRRRAYARARLLRRRLCQRPSGDAADDRRGRGRRRRRLDRLARRHRRAQGRPAERGRRSRPDLLSRRRHRADHHRRQRGARPARSGQFPRRHDEARRRRGASAASRTRSPIRSSSM